MATAQVIARRPRTSPTPKQIDARASFYQKLTAIAASLDAEIAAEKAELVALCKRCGHMPPKAERTLRVEGIEYQIDASFGESVHIDSKVVERIKCFLSNSPSTFRKLFEAKVSYVLAPTALQTLETIHPHSRWNRIQALLFQAQKVTPRAPSLKVSKRSVSVKKGGR